MPWLGNTFSLERLLGLQLFNSSLDSGLGSLKSAATDATTNERHHWKKRPALINHDPSNCIPGYVTPATSLFDDACVDVPQRSAQRLEETHHIADWPMAQLPVEIFEIITSYLTRAEVKTLRLVCSEFEAKVSGQYFRNVVVPFRSELYSSLGRDGNGVIKPSTSNLFSNGMRIFESFGPHILRFALSLELDEETLAYPPVKPVQEAVPAFWGVYRWPHETYHRYTDLEGLEQTADETEGMKEALRCLTKVSNLGLCCDAGLGFLVGPDQAARQTAARHPVFDTQDWRQDQRAPKKSNPVITVADFNDVARDQNKASFSHPENFKRKVLEKMVSDAGFAASQVDEAIDLLLDTEGTTLAHIDFDERSITVNERERRPSMAFINNVMDMDLDSEAEAEPNRDPPRHALIPANLTRAQKELLLELEWAHRAMIQSYVIGLIDNAGDGCFQNLTTLTIAKIPSAHVHILCREELWASIPSLKNVTLGVIADWRKVSKSTPGCVEDTPVSPVDAVGKVYTLLNDYIGKRPNIESIRFEWICGGEFAIGSYQRNQYILPAPFFQSPQLMISPSSVMDNTKELLRLPHIKHLSLKNCWVSPHVLLQTIRQMALCSLEKLEFESVSLCGPPTRTPQPSLQSHLFGGQNMANNANLLALIPGPGGQVPAFQAVTVVDQPTVGWTLPEVMSWPGIIEHFSPGIKVRKLRALQSGSMSASTSSSAGNFDDVLAFVPDHYCLRSDEKKYGLKCISFKSCGYVCVDVPYINTRSILPDTPQGHAAYVNGHRHDISGSMQHCKDKLLGRIVPAIPPYELALLENAFEMDIGWDKVYDEQVIEDAMVDAIEAPGMGRFSGVIESNNTDSWMGLNTDKGTDTESSLVGPSGPIDIN